MLHFSFFFFRREEDLRVRFSALREMYSYKIQNMSHRYIGIVTTNYSVIMARGDLPAIQIIPGAKRYSYTFPALVTLA